MITFNDLPQAVTQLTNEISEIKRLLLEKKKEQSSETDRWFDINELCEYHPEKPARATVYTWVREKRVPFHKRGKKLAFLKSEIDQNIKDARVKSISDIETEADSFLATKKRRG